MRNYQRQLAITLITSITMTSIASTRAWADIRLKDRSATQEVEVKRYKTVMVPKQVEVTDVQSRQVRATDIIRDDSDNYTCKAYAGMDHQILQDKYNDLRFKHAETFAEKPVGSIAVGAVAGAALTVATGGLALVGAAIGGLFGGLFSWFRGGKSEEQRDLAVRSKKAQFDEETLQLNCMENELKKSEIYAGTVPGQMLASISTSNESKATTASSSSSSNSSSSSSSSNSGSANGTADRAPSSCAYNGACNGGELYDAHDGRETYDGTQPPQVQEVQKSQDNSATGSGSGNSVAECLM